jgi:hypothetical protein
MGIGLRIFFVLNDGDRLQRISLKQFDSLWGDSKEPLPQYAGESVRYALVVLEVQDRKPYAIKSIDCGILKFDSKGQIDVNEWHRQAKLAIEMMPSLIPEPRSSPVINARSQFSKKRFEHEFQWQPSLEIRKAIEEAILGSEIKPLRLV